MAEGEDNRFPRTLPKTEADISSLDAERRRRKWDLMRKVYELEEQEGHAMSLLSKESLARHDVKAFWNNIIDLVHAWDDLLREHASISESEWLEYRRMREGE